MGWSKPGSHVRRKASKAEELLREKYLTQKNEYLELCWHYNLPPRDLSLLLMGNRNIGSEDRIKLIRLVIALSSLERCFGPGVLADHLFAPDESRYGQSGLFNSSLH